MTGGFSGELWEVAGLFDIRLQLSLLNPIAAERSPHEHPNLTRTLLDIPPSRSRWVQQDFRQ